MMQILLMLAVFLIALSMRAEDASKPVDAGTKTEGAKDEPLQPRNDLPGLKNFAKLSDGLYRGEQPGKEGFETLKKMGIKTVVNLRSFNSDRSKIEGLGLQYAHIYCKAWHPEDEDVIAFLKIVQDKSNHPVFVHCQHGADRTGMMCAVYRVVEQGWSIDAATKEVDNFGFHKMWKDIQKYLKAFDSEKMHQKVKSSNKSVDVELVK